MEILGCLPGTSTSNCLLGFWDFKVFFFFFLYFLGIELGQQDLASGGSLFWGLMFRSNSFLIILTLLLFSPWNVNYTESFIFQMEERKKAFH